jgi:hypothetical protein
MVRQPAQMVFRVDLAIECHTELNKEISRTVLDACLGILRLRTGDTMWEVR